MNFEILLWNNFFVEHENGFRTFLPQRFKNLQIIKWETSLCFDSIFKFVFCFFFFKKTVFLLSQIGLNKNIIILSVTKPSRTFFLREKSHIICHMPYTC